MSISTNEPTESFIEAPGPTGPLKGTLLSPGSQHCPVVLIVPGSGPTDRDGNNVVGVKASTYRLLAEGLVEAGIATVRIDKRGLFASAAAASDPNAVTISDYVTDVHAWTASIRRFTRGSCVWLLGHSEGALVAIAAAQNRSDICGLLLVAAPGKKIGEILLDQLRANPANTPLLHEASLAIDAVEAGKRVDVTEMHSALAALFRPKVQEFLISAFSYDPARLLAGYQKPILVLHGQRDIQVPDENAIALRQANPKATLIVLPDTNHVLKTVTSEDRGANLATYADPSLPLAPGVINAISEFVKNAAAPSR